jgi:hypothetical protein
MGGIFGTVFEISNRCIQLVDFQFFRGWSQNWNFDQVAPSVNRNVAEDHVEVKMNKLV